MIVRRLLAVAPGENVAIVCDPHSEMAMANALAGIVESVGGETTWEGYIAEMELTHNGMTFVRSVAA